MGSRTVIGRENKQMLVKHGGNYVRIPPLCLQMSKNDFVEELNAPITDENPSNTEKFGMSFMNRSR